MNMREFKLSPVYSQSHAKQCRSPEIRHCTGLLDCDPCWGVKDEVQTFILSGRTPRSFQVSKLVRYVPESLSQGVTHFITPACKKGIIQNVAFINVITAVHTLWLYWYGVLPVSFGWSHTETRRK